MAPYDDAVHDSDSASGGLEVGLKYYLSSKTFVQGVLEYQYFFRNPAHIENAFREGAFAYTLGIGYHS